MTTIENFLSIISFVDMDAFEVQLYIKKFYPHYLGTPCVVADRSGRILSVSYEAKSFGITRNIRLDRAKELCDSLEVIVKPDRWDKPDTHVTRHGSWAVFDALKEFCTEFGKKDVLEYHSSDGFFIDCTKKVNDQASAWNFVEIDKNVYVEGYDIRNRTKIFKKDVDYEIFRLLCGAAYVSEMSGYLFERTGIQCSAGISNNKLVAKMACPLHKPAGITIIPLFAFNSVAARIDLSEISGFGKEKGERAKKTLRLENLGQLQKRNLRNLEKAVGHHDAKKLYEGSRGICEEKVVRRDLNKSVSCGKSFHGVSRKMDFHELSYNLENRVDEMEERLIEEMDRHNRVTNFLQIQVELIGKKGSRKKRTKTFQISSEPNNITHKRISQQPLEIIQAFGISFKPSLAIGKVTLSASKWATARVGHNGLVCELSNLCLDSEVETESNVLESASLASANGGQNNSSSPASQQNIPTTTAESSHSVLDEENEENLPGHVYQLRISLDRTEPKIWRVVQVPEDFTFYALHKTIQDAIGWDWCMHHEFYTGLATRRGELITVGMPNKFFDGIKRIYPEKETPMKRFLGNVGDKVIYHHDFEEEWPHTVTVEEIIPAVRGRDYPCCIDGKRAAPPDDENLFSYQLLLIELRDPEAVEELHADGLYLNYDPDRFNPEDVVFNDVVVSSDDEEGDDE